MEDPDIPMYVYHVSADDEEMIQSIYLKACDHVKNYPNMPEAHYNLGNVLMAKGLKEAACEAWRAALAIKPEDIEKRFGDGGEVGREAAQNMLNKHCS